MDAAALALSIILLAAAAATTLARGATHPADQAALEDLRKSLTNPDALGWPDDGDACAWPHVSCDRTGRVDNLDLKNAGLAGTLPPSLPSLAALRDLSLQGNSLSGALPSFRGMASLQRAFLNDNDFDAIPPDFFDGLADLLEISLANNPRLNASQGGWTLPRGLADSSLQLQALSLDNCSLTGGIPDSLARLTGLQNLTLSYNNLSGPVPAALNGSAIQRLWLNNQQGDAKLSGTLDVVATMTGLQELWLHGNDFSGPVPDAIASCKELYTVRLNNNQLLGLLPPGLAALPALRELKLDNNNLLGPVPALKAPTFTFSGNEFCAAKPGEACAPEVMALLHFLAEVQYPNRLVGTWSGNDPCAGWLGVTCVQGKVTMLNLPGYGLNGTVSQSLANVTTLSEVNLAGNNLTGRVPDSLTRLASLQKLDLSMNDLYGPLPAFSPTVDVNVTGNLSFNTTDTQPTDAQPNGESPRPRPTPGASAGAGGNTSAGGIPGSGKKASSAVLLGTTIPVAVSVVALVSVGAVFLCKRRASVPPQAASVVVHPRNSSDPDNLAREGRGRGLPGHRPAPAAAADGEELAGRGGRRPDGRRRERHEPGRQQGQHPRPPRRLRRVLHLGRWPVIGCMQCMHPCVSQMSLVSRSLPCLFSHIRCCRYKRKQYMGSSSMCTTLCFFFFSCSALPVLLPLLLCSALLCRYMIFFLHWW
ncbi:Receptor-like kinase TMK2 [Zea mays]|uniref:Receptor-like kinase TMK2 n=1 Tax=Zea mays TaxID=4577 RepID=A0A1D6JIK0_MAIZE|nr:Receptor-like kinase TMK2 [Zea mays]